MGVSNAESSPALTRDVRALDREIFKLAIPALGALLVEPALIMVDTALVGHLSTPELGGLALGSTVLSTAVGLFIFLAYATTALTARRAGAGNIGDGLRAGIDGMWLAGALGTLTAIVVGVGAPWIVRALGANDEVFPYACDYLRFSAPGLPFMLIVLAATGTFRGLLDTRTPLLVSISGAVINAPLSAILIYPVGLGVAGSGLGTALAQLCMATVLCVLTIRKARHYRISIRPAGVGIWQSAVAGSALFVRTVCLRAVFLVATAVAAAMGSAELASHQVVTAAQNFPVFALDSLAIAAQALVGTALGAGQSTQARRILDRCLRWGYLISGVLGVAVAALAWWIVPLISSAHDVRAPASGALAITMVTLPIAALCYVLDGVLMGAGDGPYLAKASAVVTAVYLPAAGALYLSGLNGLIGVVVLWSLFAVWFMGARAASLVWRIRGDKWMEDSLGKQGT